jgi:serine/threonine-protein kinase HipA
VADTDFALDKGLFADGFESAGFKKTHHPGQEDFIEFARRIGIENGRAQKLLTPLLIKQEKVYELAKRCFLNESTKRAYILDYSTKRNLLAAT